MAEKTGVSWADSTFNGWIGCTRVGPGCDHCYAETLMDKRWHKVKWGSGQERILTSDKNWQAPLLWEREHEAFMLFHGHRRRVFCASLSDVFDNEVPTSWRIRLFDLIARTPHLDWMLLTKRIGNVEPMLETALFFGTVAPTATWPWPNVWLGATVVNQAEADRDIPKLLKVPAAVRFISVEPMLGPVDLNRFLWRPVLDSEWIGDGPKPSQRPKEMGIPINRVPGLHWVIAGGESGAGAREIRYSWLDALRIQCNVARVPFFFKQWGGTSASAGGCLLDGQELKAWPASVINEPERTSP